MYSVVLSEEDHDSLRKVYKDYDERFNYPPTCLREVNPLSVLNDLAYCTIKCAEYRQVCYGLDKVTFTGKKVSYLHGRFFFFDNGTCVFLTYESAHSKSRAFRGGCEHTFKELGSKECFVRGITHHGRCYHVYECKKCNRIEAYSSDD